MISFTTTVKKFGNQGEKTGWTYVLIPAATAQKLFPGNKKSFRVKGKLADSLIKGIAAMPMGDGSFILTLNATLRKSTGIRQGATIKVILEIDEEAPKIFPPFLECLQDEPEALQFFNSLPNGHRLYFSKWIASAKTTTTQAKRIAEAVNALSKGWGFDVMLRARKKITDLS